MINNLTASRWVNRILSFLAGGLFIFIVMQMTVVGSSAAKVNDLETKLDAIQYEPARLLDEGRTYFGQKNYDGAKRALNTLFEKHPAGKETMEGKILYDNIIKTQETMDTKWDTAAAEIRKEWTKSRTLELKTEFEKERIRMEKDMNDKLESEWNREKDSIRAEWEKQI